jgi:hypothetical protein
MISLTQFESPADAGLMPGLRFVAKKGEAEKPNYRGRLFKMRRAAMVVRRIAVSPPPNNRNRPLYKIRFFFFRLFFVASFLKIIYTKGGTRRVLSTNAPLTTITFHRKAKYG